MNTFKKVLSVGVVAATIVWTMGLAAFVPSASAATLAAGTLIKASGKAVYYYAADGKRYTFPNEKTFFSWFPDFSSVVTITDNELANIDLAGNVVVRPGTYLVKITTIPKVFAVEPKGMLRHVASEAAAVTLYGSAWGTKVIDLSDAFWPNYTDLNQPLTGTEYPEGQLVKMAAATDVFYVNGDASWSRVASESVFNGNMFRWEFVVVAPATMTHSAGADVAVAACQYTDVSQGGGCGVVVIPADGGALTVSRSGATPAGGVVPQGIPVEVLRFNMAASSKAVTVTSVTLHAGGISDPTNIKDVTLYAAGAKVGTTKSSVSSDRLASFNFATPVEIPAGTSKEFSVKANFSVEGFYTLGVSTSSDILSNASSVAGLPVVSNTFQAASAAATNVGSLTLDADNNDTTAMVGEDGVTLVEFTATAGAEEDVNFSALTLKNAGTIGAADMGNMMLYHDATLLATAKLDGSKYVTFVFDNVLVKKGETENFKVLGDFEGGSANDTMTLYVKDNTDVVAMGVGTGYQVSVVKTAFDSDNADSNEILLTAGQLTINLDKTAVPSADIKIDTDNIVVGKLDLKATSEALKITQLKVTFANIAGFTTSDIENAELVDLATGGILDLTFDAGTTYVTSEEIAIAKGQTKSFSVRFDATATASNNDQTRVSVANTQITAEGDVSGTAITDISPTSVTGSTMTFVKADLTHTTSTLTDSTVIGGATNVKVYKGTLKASTAAPVTLTKIVFADTNSFTDTNISLATLQINGVNVKALGGKIAEGATNTLSFDGLSYVIPAGTTQTVYLLVNVASGATGTLDVYVDSLTAKADNKTLVPAPTADTSSSTGITLAASGKFDVMVSTTETGANRNVYVVGGSTSELLGALKFDAQDEDIKVKNLDLCIANAGVTAIDDLAKVEILDSNKTTVIGTSTTFDGTVDVNCNTDANAALDLVVHFTNWNYPVVDAGVKTVYVRLSAKEIGKAPEQTGDSATVMALNVSSVTAEGVASGVTLTMAGAAAPAAGDANSQWDNNTATNSATNAAVRISGITNQLADGVLTNGSKIIAKYKFTVESNGNTDTTTGEAAKFNLQNLALTETQATATVVTAGDDLNVYWLSDPSTIVAVPAVTVNGVTIFSVDALADIATEDTLVIEANNISGAGVAGAYIQTKLDTLNATHTWKDGSGAGALTGYLLSYTSTTGAVLSN